MPNPYPQKTRAERGLSPYKGIKRSPADRNEPISTTIKNVDGKPKLVTTGGNDWQKLQRESSEKKQKQATSENSWQKLQRESREKKQANSFNPRRGGAGFGQ